MEHNLTTGSVAKNVFRFSIPFLFSYLLQTLYGLADLFVVGLYDGVAATTAVSVGSQVMHMLTVMIVGLAMGSTVVIARAVGGEDARRKATAVGNTVTLFGVLSIVLTGVLLLCVQGITGVILTPPEAVAGTRTYLRICFLGIPFITAYNIIASVLRGMGDSRTPLLFVFAACVLNIALDFLFIGGLGMGPAGAALGTVLAQAASVILALTMLARRNGGVSLRREDLRPDRRVMGAILRVGLPVAAQDGFIQVSFLVITAIVNKRGVTDAAAVGIVEKMITMLFLVPSSMLSAVSALGAQNIGAGRRDRARSTLRTALCIAVGWGLLVAGTMLLAAEPFVSLFTNDAAVVRMGGGYMRGYVWDCTLAGMHFCFSGYFCAVGRSELSFLHNAVAIVLARIPLAYLASARFPATLFPMGLATSFGSLVSVIVCLLLYKRLEARQNAGPAEEGGTTAV